MMYGTYTRLNVRTFATNREVIAAARKKLKKKFRRDRASRDMRHKFYRAMLKYHSDAQDMCIKYRI